MASVLLIRIHQSLVFSILISISQFTESRILHEGNACPDLPQHRDVVGDITRSHELGNHLLYHHLDITNSK